MDEDQERKLRASVVLGEDLSEISISELADRIALLKREIERHESAIVAKDAARLAADAVFGSKKTE
ncbi:MAG: DUF1192 domain-containing protein [Pseudomonadota bacterium]